jgi:hypothetical protein
MYLISPTCSEMCRRYYTHLWSINVCKHLLQKWIVNILFFRSLLLCRSPKNSNFSPRTLMKGTTLVRWPATARHRRLVAAWRSPKARRVVTANATKPQTPTATVIVTHRQATLFLLLIIRNRIRHMKRRVPKVSR